MAESVLIIGESGSGKSTSGRNLDPRETFWINVANKSLPFKGWKNKYTSITKEKPTEGNMSKAHKPAAIIHMLNMVSDKMPHIKTVIIDDLQYMSAFEYFDKADEKGYDKFTEIAKGLASVVKHPITLRDDLTVVFMTHVEDTQDHRGRKTQKAKTIGKMVDQALTLEGLFSIVLYAKARKGENGNLEFIFETKNDGSNTCKTPMGMFQTDDIPNDLQLVKDAIFNYEN